MKKILQSLLILILVSSIAIFYHTFFNQNENTAVILDENIGSTENNVVKNLK